MSLTEKPFATGRDFGRLLASHGGWSEVMEVSGHGLMTEKRGGTADTIRHSGRSGRTRLLEALRTKEQVWGERLSCEGGAPQPLEFGSSPKSPGPPLRKVNLSQPAPRLMSSHCSRVSFLPLLVLRASFSRRPRIGRGAGLGEAPPLPGQPQAAPAGDHQGHN